jgi:UDP-glucose 4-epimerase
MTTRKLAMIGNPTANKMKLISYYKKKTVLVTGGSGYIGSGLIKRLKTVPCCLIAPTKNEADIRKKGIWKELLKKVDVLFHLAGQTSSKFSNEKPLLDTKINLLPVINIIKTCQKNNLSPDIIFAGTATEVGLTKRYPVNEAFKNQPITVYDINKLAAEKYLQYYSYQLGKRAVTLRLANVYGPGPASSRADRGILNLFIKKALRREDITIYGKGNFVRDYIYIDDVVNAFLVAGVKIDVLKGNYFIIGSNQGHTIKEMATLISQEVAKKTGRRVKIVHVVPPENLSPIEFRNFIADSRQFMAKTGWQPKVSLRQGIKRTIDFFLKDGCL